MTFACLKRALFFCLLALAAAHGQQQERVAILNTEDDGDDNSVKPSDLSYLTNRLRETAVNILPGQRYGIMTIETIVAFLGSQENARKVCKEASCLADVGRKVSADYVAQARIGRFGNRLSINFQLYNSKSGNMIGSFTGNSKDIDGLLAIIDEKAPALFRQMPGASGGSKAVSPSIEGGISGLQSTGGGYEFEGGKSYLASISTEPEGAVVSFNGVPSTNCVKTPCKLVLGEGNVRIVAAFEQYERADTTIFIKQNNQSINIRLKANFGVLDIKPAYSDGIGKNEPWSLTINGKSAPSLENRLSPGKYKVVLNHRCYETMSFDAGINKDKREVFDMAGNIKLKKGGLSLNAERNNEPISEPVYVNGKQSGETPFSGSVPVCAEIEIGKSREKVDVKLKPNEKVEHTVKGSSGVSGGSFTDSRDGKKYKTVKIGKQTWMAENLNYNASGGIYDSNVSECYDNKKSNCQKYGRLYDRMTAMESCPKSWHLPSDEEWQTLVNFAGGNKKAGTKLKAKSDWNNKGKSGNGTDDFGFAALPGGYLNNSFYDIGNHGNWWSATSYYVTPVDEVYSYLSMNYGDEIEHTGVGAEDSGDFWLSVRCVKD